MGFISDFTGKSEAKAARRAQESQRLAQEKAIKTVKAGTEKAREPLDPFATAGLDTIASLTELITNPEAQKDFILNNPFFDLLTEQAERDLLQNQAAAGKVGSGDTAKALQESYVLLGADLVNQSVAQRQNLITGIGLPAAFGVSSLESQETANVANLQVGIGESEAAGDIGSAQARAAGSSRIVNTALQIASLGMAGGGAPEDFGRTRTGGTPTPIRRPINL